MFIILVYFINKPARVLVPNINGVKQGGCLSPSLFSINLNNLILNLRNSNIGCKYRFKYKILL